MRTKILLLAAVLALAACDQGAAPTAQQPVAQPQAVQPAAPAPAPAPVGIPPIGDGVAFTFPYVINKDHSVPGSDGVRNREILIEYSEGDLKVMDERVRQAFIAKGYARAKPATRNGAVHSIYRKEGQGEVRVWIREGLPPGDRFKAVSQSMLGSIYIVAAAPATSTATAAAQ